MIKDFHAIEKHPGLQLIVSHNAYKSHPDLDHHSDSRFTNHAVSGSNPNPDPDPKIGLIYQNYEGKGHLGFVRQQVNWASQESRSIGY
jgi:hypothetical protein